MAEELKLTRLMELHVLKRELQGYRSNVVFAGCDVGKLLEELLVWADALAAATARAEAAEAKVRDMETLLGWLRPDTELIFRLGLNDERTIAVVEEWKERDDAKAISWCHWDNESAVSAAAQWVRENSPPQKKPTDEGGRGDEPTAKHRD